jgi:hypothetical protein
LVVSADAVVAMEIVASEAAAQAPQACSARRNSVLAEGILTAADYTARVTAPDNVPPTPSRTAVPATAVVALIAGACGFSCLPGLGGVLAIALGLAAKSEIEHSAGVRHGARMARTAIGLGIANLIAVGVAAIVMLVGISRPKAVAATPSTAGVPPATAPPSRQPMPTAATSNPSAPAPARPMSRDDGVVETVVGKVILVDVGPDIPSLTHALEQQRRTAAAAGETVLLWLVVPDCRPCDAVAAGLPDPLLQTALAQARLVRLDLREFGGELGHLGVPLARADGAVLVPAFVLLDETNRPTDYINGGEWDADTARNMAPVLGKFVRGTYTERRSRWQSERDQGVTL